MGSKLADRLLKLKAKEAMRAEATAKKEAKISEAKAKKEAKAIELKKKEDKLQKARDAKQLKAQQIKQKKEEKIMALIEAKKVKQAKLQEDKLKKETKALALKQARELKAAELKAKREATAKRLQEARDAKKAKTLESNGLQTEDLGKIFEMAICILYETNYDGKYKYSMEEANKLKDRIHKLKEVFPYEIKHIAKNGSQYDFVCANDSNIHLSAKTTKIGDKVCPQVIGQPSRKKFCSFFGIDNSFKMDQIKLYIENNVNNLLETYSSNTFDCPIIYYNQHKNLLMFVKLKKDIDWSNHKITFSHIIKKKEWNESSSILINNKTIGEFQVHNHRDCIKFRWSFEKILELFNENFEIQELPL